MKTEEKTPKIDGTARWRVEEVYRSPSDIIVRLTVANYITEGEAWPKVGQELKVVENEF